MVTFWGWGLFDLLSVLELGGCEINIIGLPAQGREAHVEAWCGDAVDAAEFIHPAVEAKGVEDLSLKAPLVVDATVAAALAAVKGFVGGHNLDVAAVVTELALGFGLGHEPVLVRPRVDPLVGVGAVEYDLGVEAARVAKLV